MDPVRYRLFVGTSREDLKVGLSIQNNLEHDAEVTVWNQGIFQISKFSLEGLIDALGKYDFAAFVFSPQDEVKIRGKDFPAVRDNVLFELGLFIGGLGLDRCFIVRPETPENLHLPTDLLGLIEATYRPDRSDGNLVAALGPACQKILMRMKEIGGWQEAEKTKAQPAGVPLPGLDENDIVSKLETWLKHRTDNNEIEFAKLDSQMNLPPGSASKFLEKAGANLRMRVRRKGNTTLLFEEFDATSENLNLWRRAGGGSIR